MSHLRDRVVVRERGAPGKGPKSQPVLCNQSFGWQRYAGVPFVVKGPSVVCWISCDPDDRLVATVVDHLGDDRLVWASDYPHLDAREGPLKKFYARQAALSEESRRKILHDNPRRLYGI
jgi:hypothetical protein